MRMRKKKHTDERLQACSSVLVSDPEAHKGQWRPLFGPDFAPDAPLEMEIGCGSLRSR